jgi:hypothetical protein
MGGDKADVEGGEEKGKKKERKRKEEDSLIDENSMRKMSCDSVWVRIDL